MTRYALLTRHPADCSSLQRLIEPHGWSVRPYPVLRVADYDDPTGWHETSRLLQDWHDGPWLAIASPRAPQRVKDQAQVRGFEELLQLRIASIGEATATAAARAGMRVDLVGPGTGTGLAKELVPYLEPRCPVISACGRDHRPELKDTLEAAGHPVQPLLVYAMEPTPPRELPPLGENLEAVILTSPRAARLYLDGVGGKPLPIQHWALGPTTRQAAAALGITCRIPSRPDFASLAEELCQT